MQLTRTRQQLQKPATSFQETKQHPNAKAPNHSTDQENQKNTDTQTPPRPPTPNLNCRSI